jgi:hypothetical protein
MYCIKTVNQTSLSYFKINDSKNKSLISEGKLDPESKVGIGYKTECTIEEFLGDCDNCNKDKFNSPYDLISKKYGKINVKSCKLKFHKHGQYYYWNFRIKKNSQIPDYYVCIAFNDENRSRIEHVWFINNFELLNNAGIHITNCEKSLSRFKQYEIDPNEINDIYINLDINNMSVFKNFKPYSYLENL